MIQPSAFRQSPADLPGPCRRTRCPAASYTTPRDTIEVTAAGAFKVRSLPGPWHAVTARLRPLGFGVAAFATRGLAQPKLAERAKAGGGRRTRTFEAIRRLIYSQLPLPLGTLPRSSSTRGRRPNRGWKTVDDDKTNALLQGAGWAGLWRKRHGKVNQGRQEYIGDRFPRCKLPLSGARERTPHDR